MPRSTQFYWYDGEKDSILLEGVIEEDELLEYGDGLFDTEEEAYDSLERIADRLEDESLLYGLKLKKTGHTTVGEAEDRLFEQSGLTEFQA